jgi:hypothetical protein
MVLSGDKQCRFVRDLNCEVGRSRNLPAKRVKEFRRLKNRFNLSDSNGDLLDLNGAPEEIRTPDPQIRSLSVRQRSRRTKIVNGRASRDLT